MNLQSVENFLAPVETQIEGAALSAGVAILGAVSTVLAPVPSDELAILKNGLAAGVAVLKAGGTVSEAITAALNSIAQAEVNEFREVTNKLAEALMGAIGALVGAPA